MPRPVLTNRFADHANGNLPAEFIFTLVSTNESSATDTIVDERGMGFTWNYRSDDPNANPALKASQALYVEATAIQMIYVANCGMRRAMRVLQMSSMW